MLGVYGNHFKTSLKDIQLLSSSVTKL